MKYLFSMKGVSTCNSGPLKPEGEAKGQVGGNDDIMYEEHARLLGD